VPDLLADLPTRLLPPGYLGELDPAFLPQGFLATLLFEWTGTVFWSVVLVAGLATFARTPPPEVVVALGCVLAACGLAVDGCTRRGRWARAGSVLALLVVVAAAAQSLNGVYREYPTLRTVLGPPAADQLPFTTSPRRPARPGLDGATGHARRRDRHSGRHPRPPIGVPGPARDGVPAARLPDLAASRAAGGGVDGRAARLT
jgi:hypothetical protein